MLFCGCARKSFCGRVPQSLSQFHTCQCFPEVTVDALVSLLQGRRVRQQKRQPCMYLLERFLTFNTKSGRTVFSDLAALKNVAASQRTSSANDPQPSSMALHSHFRFQFGNLCVHLSLYTWFAHASRISTSCLQLRFSLVLLERAVWPSFPAACHGGVDGKERQT